jgi:hypothetical protein
MLEGWKREAQNRIISRCGRAGRERLPITNVGDRRRL